MQGGGALVADGEAAVAGEPGQRVLDDPAVPPQLGAGVDPLRAMRTLMRRAWSAWRQRRKRKSYALSACSLSGRLRGRPCCPAGRRMGGTASTRTANGVGLWRLAGVRQGTRGTPRRSTTRWRFVPGLSRSVGFGPTCSAGAPPFCRDARAVQARPYPVDPVRPPQPLEQGVVQPLPHARCLPVP